MFLLILRFMSMIENAIVTFVHVSVTVPVDAVILVFEPHHFTYGKPSPQRNRLLRYCFWQLDSCCKHIFFPRPTTLMDWLRWQTPKQDAVI